MTSAVTVAVIGHVNHGKTALVRALTGIETDRLAEEKARGLSITLGFAWRAYAAGVVELIDAPGHEDFIRAMVAGATGARAVLLVVSATEGFGRQTWEHLKMATLLGIQTGIVAITKADLIGPDAELAMRADIQDRLRDTFLAGAPILACSSVAQGGLTKLSAALEALLVPCGVEDSGLGAFLPIDRVFTLTGTGTVISGTLQGGSLWVGTEAVLEPSGRRVGLRQIQVHGQAVEDIGPGRRVAINLRGVSADEVRAGEVLCMPNTYETSLQVDVMATLSPDSPRPLTSLDEVRVLWGTRQDMATARLMEGPALLPGEQGLIQLRFSSPVIAFAGQRGVLRRPSPALTLGGFDVLDPQAPRLRGKAGGRAEMLHAVATGHLIAIASGLAVRDGGHLAVSEAARLGRRTETDVRAQLDREFEALDDTRMGRRAVILKVWQAYLDAVARAHLRAPIRTWALVNQVRDAVTAVGSPALISHVEQKLAAAGEIRLRGSHVALRDHDPLAGLSAEATSRLAAMERELREGGLTPPDIAALVGATGDQRDLLDLLLETGRAVLLRNVALRQDLVFHAQALVQAVQALRKAFPPPIVFTTGEARASLETSRKFIVPLLEHLDSLGETVRRGDVRQLADVQGGD